MPQPTLHIRSTPTEMTYTCGDLVTRPDGPDRYTVWRDDLQIGLISPAFGKDACIWTAFRGNGGYEIPAAGVTPTTASALVAIARFRASCAPIARDLSAADDAGKIPRCARDDSCGWPSATARTGHIPVGLPLPSTAPLTAAEREVLAALARALDVMAGLVRDALGRNRVDLALDAAIRTAGVGDQARSITVKLGRNR